MGFNGVEIKDMDLVVVKKGGREIRQELVAIDKFLIKGLVRRHISRVERVKEEKKIRREQRF